MNEAKQEKKECDSSCNSNTTQEKATKCCKDGGKCESNCTDYKKECKEQCSKGKCSSKEAKNSCKKEKIEVLEKEIETLKEQVLMAKADGINHLSRAYREFDNQKQNIENSVISGFLDIFDYYQKGMDYAKKIDSSEVKNLVFGFNMVNQQLNDFLASKNIETFNSKDEKFDPLKHNPIHSVTSDEVSEPTVTKQFTVGYSRKGKVIKLSNVEVTSPKEKEETAEKEIKEESEISENDSNKESNT